MLWNLSCAQPNNLISIQRYSRRMVLEHFKCAPAFALGIYFTSNVISQDMFMALSLISLWSLLKCFLTKKTFPGRPKWNSDLASPSFYSLCFTCLNVCFPQLGCKLLEVNTLFCFLLHPECLEEYPVCSRYSKLFVEKMRTWKKMVITKWTINCKHTKIKNQGFI